MVLSKKLSNFDKTLYEITTPASPTLLRFRIVLLRTERSAKDFLRPSPLPHWGFPSEIQIAQKRIFIFSQITVLTVLTLTCANFYIKHNECALSLRLTKNWISHLGYRALQLGPLIFSLVIEEGQFCCPTLYIFFGSLYFLFKKRVKAHIK